MFGKTVAAYSDNCKEQIISEGEMRCVAMLEIFCT